MEQIPVHTSLSDLRESYHHIFSSGLSFSRLKDEALTDRLFPKQDASSNEAPGVSGRSIAWKLFLAKHEPLQASAPPRTGSLLEELRKSRNRYSELLVEKTRPPDERLKGVPSTTTSKPLEVTRNVNLNNPLSLHNENPWNEWFAGLEVKTTIAQDVERTFPDIPFFRETEIQSQLTNILFIYASTHPRIGYRQGMHELLAPLYYAIYFDSVDESAAVEPELREICSVAWIAADAWALFDTVMDGVSTWYEWREPDYRTLAAEREISTLRNRDKRLGDSLGWIVDVLLQDEESTGDVERLRRRRREAVESLSYIRDVLISETTELEEERLTSEEVAADARKRRQQRTESSTSPPHPVIQTPTPPLPVTVVDSGTRSSTDRKVIRAHPNPFSPNKSIVTSSSDGADLAKVAPWNHTRSSFSRPVIGLPSTTLPRKPPPTSSGNGEQRKSGVAYDPLGAL